MYAQVIQQMDPHKIDDDTINSLKIMLEHETFKEFHPLINQKLEEVRKVREDPEKIVGSFSLEVGKFYKTLNDSIVKCINVVYSPPVKKGDAKKPLAYYMFVLKGGYVDPDINGELAASQYGNTTENGAYVVDTAGRFVAFCEDEKNYPMHIKTEINLKLTVD